MKKIIILLMLLGPFIVSAQKKPPKPPKPSMSKAEKAMKEGKWDLARQIIDITVASEKFSTKAKAWLLRAIIYASIDSSRDETIKEGVSAPFATARQSFEQYDALQDEKNPVYLTDPVGLPMLPSQIKGTFAQWYFNAGLEQYQDNEDYKEAFDNVEKAVFFVPEDSSVLLNIGLFFAPAAKEYEKAIEYLKKYLELGGKSSDAYTMLFGIYRDQLEDYEQALAVAKAGAENYPQNPNFPKYELDIYIKMNRLEEARSAMEKQIENDPNDAETRYYLGVVSQELKEDKTALKWYQQALAVKPDYLEACTAVAEIIYSEAKEIKRQMNALGISKEDQKKRLQLDELLVAKLKMTLPHWEKCEKIQQDSPKVLDNLLNIFNDLGIESQVKRIRDKMKSLGLF